MGFWGFGVLGLPLRLSAVSAFAAFGGVSLRLRLRLPPCVWRAVSSVSLRLGPRLRFPFACFGFLFARS